MPKRKKPFHGWLIVFAGTAMLAISLGMFNSTNSVFVKPVCASLGFARGEFTLHRTIILLTGALLMPLYGRWIQKNGVKKILLLGALMLSVSAFGYSFSTKLWHFYAVAVLNGLFVNGVGFMSVGVLINAWFTGKKGLAVGLAFAGSGLGGAIMVPLIGRVIERISWQWAYRLMGSIGLVILVPIIALLVKNDPADMGLAPLPDDRGSLGEKRMPADSLSFREATRTGKFWLLLVSFFFISFFASATNTHSAPYISDLGYSTAFVSSVVSVFMLFLTIGKVSLGLVYDRFGALCGNVLIAVFGLAFPIFALLSHIPAMPFLYAVSIGMASCGMSVPLSIWVSRFFGQKDFPTLLSFYSMVGSFASSLSVPGMGTIYDMTGSYRPAWWIFLLTSTIMATCLISAEWMHRKRTAERQPL